MDDFIVTVILVAMFGTIAAVMWKKNWWGKIISVFCAGTAAYGITTNVWALIVVVIVAIVAAIAAAISKKK